MKLSTRQVTLIAAGIGTVSLVIFLGVTETAKYNEKIAKEKAKIAYENRAIVEQSCVMNGLGQGHCDFTNTGKSTGSMCGMIQVEGPGVVTSNKFCSGQVQPQSTTKVEFVIPPVDELCDNGFESWMEKCSFSFVEDDNNNNSAPITDS